MLTPQTDALGVRLRSDVRYHDDVGADELSPVPRAVTGEGSATPAVTAAVGTVTAH
jgi:hypothetical protein